MHHGVTRDERGSQQPCRGGIGVVPRRHDGHDTARLSAYEVERLTPTGERAAGVAEPRGGGLLQKVCGDER